MCVCVCFLSRETNEEPISRCFGFLVTKKIRKKHILFMALLLQWCVTRACSRWWGCRPYWLLSEQGTPTKKRNKDLDQIILLCTTKISEKGLPVCIEWVILIKMLCTVQQKYRKGAPSYECFGRVRHIKTDPLSLFQKSETVFCIWSTSGAH